MSMHDDKGEPGGRDPSSGRLRPSRRGGRRRGPGPGGASRRHLRLKRITAWLSVFVVVALTAGALTAYWEYRHLWDGIGRFTIVDLGKRPPVYNNAVNVLVFGTDSRNGLSLHQQIRLHVGRSQGEQNTDTIMIVHILPGRKGAIVVSIPRDTQVPYYACPRAGKGMPGQQQDLGATERINAVFAAGGASCLWKTVEQQTGIRIDHAIELDFTGFVKIINDLGGVNVCASRRVYDPVSGLFLRKGINHIGGVEALKYWRTREGIGMGDDPQRIQRDQFLMAAVLQGVKHSGLLSNPAKLVRVLGDIAGSMKMDDGMTPADLLSIGESLRGLPPKSVQFITSPWTPDPSNANLVDFARPRASQLFSAIAHDQKLPKALKGGSHKKGKSPPTALVKTAQPSSVNVEVLNGSGVSGVAGAVATRLTNRGFKIVGTGDAANFGYAKSVIEYSSAADRPAANTLKAQLSSVTLKRNSSLAAGTIELIVGSSFTALKPPPPPTQQAVTGLSHKYKGITGSTSVCKDTGAFSGPLGY
jgi:LCP family protein required for cell wall assembly